MKRLRVVSGLWTALLVATVLVLPAATQAQSVTTGSLSGSVTDESGGVLPGATVEAVHEPTGTRYSPAARCCLRRARRRSGEAGRAAR